MGMYDREDKWYIVIMKTKIYNNYAGFKFVLATDESDARLKSLKDEFGNPSQYDVDSLIETGTTKPYIHS